MSDRAKRGVAAALLVLAALLAVGAVVLWTQASDDAEAANLAHDYAEAISGRPSPDEEPDRVPALVAGAVAAVCALGGAVLLAGSKPEG